MIRTALSLVVLAGACHGPSPAVVRAADNELRRVPDEARTGRAERAPQPGDWLLQSRDLRVGIAATPRRARAFGVGAVLQVLDRDLADAEPLRGADFFVRLDGREVEPRDGRFEPLLVRDTPTLRYRAHVPSPAGDLELTRDYHLEPGRRALHVRTRLANRGRALAGSVVLGARLSWGGDAPFAPGLGLVATARDGVIPWVGRAVDGLALAWTRPFGEIPASFTDDVHAASRTAGATELRTPPAPLGPGAVAEESAVLLLRRGALADVARAAAQLRTERFLDTPFEIDGLTAPERARVTVRDATHTVVLVTEAAAPRAVLPVAPGSYTAVVTVDGHADGDPVRFDAHEGASPVTLSVPPGGRLRVDVTDLDSDRPLPSRVTLQGIAPTRDPYLGPHHDARGAGVVVIAPDGHADVPVPPGRYRVTVSHGPEWTLSTTEVTVTPTLRGAVRAALRHVVPLEGWVSCDLHVHADPSFDSRVTIEDRVASLVAEGVAFATPTEHNVVGDYTAGVAALSPATRETLRWVPAVEVTTDRSASPWGHFNIYPYRPDPELPGGGPPPFLNTPPRTIFRAARQNNPEAIIQVNHPRMQPNIGYFNVVGLDPRTNRAVSPEYDPTFDAIEVFNGFYVGQLPVIEQILRDWYALLSSGARYVATGSSDSHSIAYQWAGYPRTYVRAPANDTAALLRNLRAGRAFVTSGPALLLSTGPHGPGDHVPLAQPQDVTFRVQVLAPPWIPVDTVELVRDGQRVAVINLRRGADVVRLDTTVTLALAPGSWVVALARGPAGALDVVLPNSRGVPFAFTNPVFFDRALGPTPPGP